MGWAVVLALAAAPPSAVVTSVPAATIVATDSARRDPCDGFRRNGVTGIILLAPRYSVVCPWRPVPITDSTSRTSSRAAGAGGSSKRKESSKFYPGGAGRDQARLAV